MPRLRSLAVAAAVAALALPASAAAAPAGSFDPSWSGDGLSRASFGPGSASIGRYVARQPDGRIVVAGSVTRPGGGQDLAVARFLADGTPDAGFGDGGRRTLAIGDGVTTRGVEVLPDGRILVFGDATLPGFEHADAFTLRLQSNGSPDATNGSAGGVPGVRRFSITQTSIENAGAMTLDAQGRPYLAGAYADGSTERIFLARLGSDGALDTSWSGDGLHLRDVQASKPERVNAIAVHGDRITVSGDVYFVGSQAFVVRFVNAQAVGSDHAFGVFGLVLFGPADDLTGEGGLVVLDDDRVRLTSRDGDFDAIYGFTAGGSPDPGFGTGGKVVHGPTTAARSNLLSLVPGPGGTLYVGGMLLFGEFGIEGEIERLRADGRPDPTWSGDGIASLRTAAPLTGAGDLVLEPDGDVVAAGIAGSGVNDASLAAYRLNGTDKPGPVPPTGGGGSTAPQQAPAGPSPEAPARPAAGPPVATPRAAARAADVIALPAARRCLSKRTVAFRLRAPRGGRIVAATVRVGKGRTRTISGRRLTGAATSLEGLPKGTVKVVVKATLSSGERLTLTRTYRTCARKKRR